MESPVSRFPPRCSGWASSSLISPSRNSLPRKRCRVGLHIDLFEACSAFTRVAARTLARSPIRDQLHRRLQPFRHLHHCSGCFRLERSPGGACTHWKAPPCHGAHVKRSFRIATVASRLGKAVIHVERYRTGCASRRLTHPFGSPRPVLAPQAGVAADVDREDRGEAAGGGHCSGTPASRRPSSMRSSSARYVGS